VAWLALMAVKGHRYAERPAPCTPHVHGMATRGGWEQQARQWSHLDSLPSSMLRKQWQWLPMVRQTLQTQESQRVVEACDTSARGVWPQCAKRGRPVSRSELGDLSGPRGGEAAQRAAAYRPRGWSQGHLA
jgi:hypothetical protein